MSNHYHLIVETPQPTLSRGMHLVNGAFARHVNERYGRRGHVFESRFWSVLVEGEEQLLQTCRYVALNPVRARLCRSPGEWRWR